MGRSLFGILAVKNGFATEAEVETALEAQQGDPGGAPRVGEILVQMGTLTPEKVRAVLVEQDCVARDPLLVETTPLPLVARLVQESGPPVAVNGVAVPGDRLLVAGDRVRIGPAVFVVEGAAIGLLPVRAADASATDLVPVADRRTDDATVDATPTSPSALAKIDAAVARLLPSIHNHRKYLAVSLLPGLAALVLPWRLVGVDRWLSGIQGPGWPTFLLTTFAATVVLGGPLALPLRRLEKGIVVATTGLALALVLFKLFAPPPDAVALGLGLPLAMLSAIAGHLVVWLCRAEPGPASDLVFARVRRGMRAASGRRDRERKAALERRDELLRQLGELALSLDGAPGADAEAAAAAKRARDATPSSRSAESAWRRAVQKLGRQVVERDLKLDGRQLPSGEIRQLDGRIRSLS